jgi:hypothetical protein
MLRIDDDDDDDDDDWLGIFIANAVRFVVVVVARTITTRDGMCRGL